MTMYVLERDQFSPGLRQGDVLAGRVLAYPDLNAQELKKWEGAIKEGARYSVNCKGEVRSDFFLVLSQCCDLQDKRILVAQLMKAEGHFGRDGLGVEQQGVLSQNLLWVSEEDVEGSALSIRESGVRVERKKLVAPGVFWLDAIPGELEDPHLAMFGAMRGIRTKEIGSLRKVAELTLVARGRLRRRLAVFFGRVPKEDLATE